MWMWEVNIFLKVEEFDMYSEIEENISTNQPCSSYIKAFNSYVTAYQGFCCWFYTCICSDEGKA